MYRRPVFRTNVFTRQQVRRRPPARPPTCSHFPRCTCQVSGGLTTGRSWGGFGRRLRGGRHPRRTSFRPRAIGPLLRPRTNREPSAGRRRPVETARPTWRLVGFPGDFPRPPGCPPLGRRSSRNPSRIGYYKIYAAARSPIAAAVAAAGTTWYVLPFVSVRSTFEPLFRPNFDRYKHFG